MRHHKRNVSRRATTQFALALLAAGVVGCGSGGTGDDTTPDVVTLDTDPMHDGDRTDTPDSVDDIALPDDTGLIDAGPACIDNTDCQGGQVCRAGICREVCGSDAECPDARPVCDLTAGLCVACLGDETCTADQICERNTCVDPACETSTDCQGGERCAAGRCRSVDPVICSPAQTRCDGDTLWTCSRDGTQETSTVCEAGCQDDPAPASCAPPIVCTPASIGCLDATTAFLCEDSGRTQLELPCPAGQRCSDGTCVRPPCQPDQTRCQGEVLEHCPDGDWVEARDCTDEGDRCRDGACVAFSCEPDESLCVGGRHVRCTDGTETTLVEDCSAGGAPCRDGACVPLICTIGETSCDGNVAVRCSEDRTARVRVDCATTGQSCDAGACRDRICTAASTRCNGGNVQTCAPDGLGWDLTQTCGAPGCADGVCNDPCLTSDHTACSFLIADADNVSVTCDSLFLTCPNSGSCISGFCNNTADAMPIVLHIGNPNGTAAFVRVFDGSDERGNITIPAGAMRTLETTASGQRRTRLATQRFEVRSDLPVVVVAVNGTVATSFSSDSTLALPARQLDRTYTVIGWAGLSETYPGQLNIVAVDPAAASVNVAVTPTVPIRAATSGPTVAATGAGSTRTYTITSPGTQTLALAVDTTVTPAGDLTGTRIQASAPVAVLASATCANIPQSVQFCDHVQHQLVPDTHAGTEWILAPLRPRGAEATVVRIVATQGDTTIRTVPALAISGTTLAQGGIATFEISTPVRITTTRPAHAALYMVGTAYPAAPVPITCDSGQAQGDPAMILAAHVEAAVNDAAVVVPSGFDFNTVTIISRAEETPTMNGRAIPGGQLLETTPVGQYRVTYVRADPGFYRFAAPSGVTVQVYGTGCGRSYGHAGAWGFAR